MSCHPGQVFLPGAVPDVYKRQQKKMEILRGIFDQSNVGIVIAGEPRLETELKGNLARFANRMDFYYKLKGLSKNEVVDYLEGYEVDEACLLYTSRCV